MPGSACDGRMSQYVYLALWEAIKASIAAMFMSVST